MAKKHKYETPAMPVSMEPSPRHDNHTPGIGHISYASDPANRDYDRTPAAPGKKVCFPSMVGKGESPMAPDVNVVTANGISNSKYPGNRGLEYNWGDGTDGEWNRNRDFEGGNISGL
jgi:hypothetical protein